MNDEQKHIRWEEIELTPEQRRMLSVTRDVVIPGAAEQPEPINPDGVKDLVPVPDEDPGRAARGYVRMVPADGPPAAPAMPGVPLADIARAITLPPCGKTPCPPGQCCKSPFCRALGVGLPDRGTE